MTDITTKSVEAFWIVYIITAVLPMCKVSLYEFITIFFILIIVIENLVYNVHMRFLWKPMCAIIVLIKK